MPARQLPFVRQPAAGLLAVFVLWATALVLIRPYGDFPLMDDWIYAFGVNALVTDGAVRFSPYMEATAIAHLLWGALFTWASGFSFEWLRVSTLVLAAAGIAGAWTVAREVGARAGAAAFAAALFAFNPLALTLSNSFMTDVPFAVWTMFTCLFMLRALAQPCWATALTATLFAVVTTCVRDQGLAWPIAFVPAALFAWPRGLRSAAMAVTPIVACAAVWWLYGWWVDATGRRPENVGLHTRQLVAIFTGTGDKSLVVFAKTLANVSFHLGWYALPAVIFTGAALVRRHWIRWLWIPAVTAIVLASGEVAPWGSSVLYDLGVGPMMLRPIETGVTSAIIPAPRWIWILATVGAALSGAAMAIRVAVSLRQRLAARTPADRVAAARIVFLAAAIVIFMTPLMLVGFYDRYLVSCIALATALCLLTTRAERPSPVLRAGAVALLAVYAMFGVAAAHDYFAWNHARWIAIHRLEATGKYQVQEIDGGVEYAGFHGYHRKGVPLDLPDAIVIVALEPITGTTVCGQVPWRRWLPPRQEALSIVGVRPDACR